jgi:hypothetical protein
MTSLLLALVACDPHDATVEASYVMYFGNDSSKVIELERKAAPDPKACDEENAAPEGGTVFDDECYQTHVEEEKTFAEDLSLVPYDCREFPSAYTSIQRREARLKGFDYENTCCREAIEDEGAVGGRPRPDGDELTTEDCTPITPREFPWLDDYAYYIWTAKVAEGDGTDPHVTPSWREEVVLTTEHDLQMVFHARTQFGDLRFGWVIDPLFAPTECRQDEEGNIALQPVDDGDWIEHWSDGGEEGTTTYYLNAGAAQNNPSNQDEWWSLKQEWRAGMGFMHLGDPGPGDETFYSYATDYQDMGVTWNPDAQDSEGNVIGNWSEGAASPLWLGVDDDGAVTSGYTPGQFDELDCERQAEQDAWGEGAGCNSFDSYQDFYDAVHTQAQLGGTSNGRDDTEKYYTPLQDELEEIGGISADDIDIELLVEDNGWRWTPPGPDAPAEERLGKGADPVGLKNWVGLNLSWVRFNASQETLAALEVGELATPLTGTFQWHGYSLASATRVLIKGSFEITRITEDAWGYSPTLDEIKLAENDPPECGE